MSLATATKDKSKEEDFSIIMWGLGLGDDDDDDLEGFNEFLMEQNIRPWEVRYTHRQILL